MITLIIGGSASGKSAYAEDYATTLSEGGKKYYIATMQAFDEESRKRIKRHQRMRSRKGFSTIEQPVAIEYAIEKMEAGEKTALLECISNLAANEMFSEKIPKKEEQVTERIKKGILALNEELTHLVIVSNNVFEDGEVYDETTMEYICTMGKINEALAVMADKVIEVVVGIPVVLKERQEGEED